MQSNAIVQTCIERHAQVIISTGKVEIDLLTRLIAFEIFSDGEEHI